MMEYGYRHTLGFFSLFLTGFGVGQNVSVNQEFFRKLERGCRNSIKDPNRINSLDQTVVVLTTANPKQQSS